MHIIRTPELLSEKHDISFFDCGVASLNDWLKHRALKNILANASKVFVVCSENRVVGYYCLAAGAIEHKLVPPKIKRNMPDPIPVMILGRLAVDKRWMRLGIGSGLLKDAILRTLAVSKMCGMRALLVHALSDDAKKFYLKNGFMESPLNPLTLMLSLKPDLTSAS